MVILFASIPIVCIAGSLSLSQGLVAQTLLEVRQAVASAREKYVDVKVSTYHETTPLAGHTHSTHNEIVAGKDRRIVLRTISYWTDKVGAERNTGLRTFAYDGERSLIMGELAQSATYTLSIEKQARTISDNWFALNLLNPGIEPVEGIVGPDLQAIVDSPGASVRPVTEVVNGRECVVVECPVVGGTWSQKTVWIDLDRSCVVMKWNYYVADNQLATSSVAEVVEEVAPSLWLVVEGRVESFDVAPSLRTHKVGVVIDPTKGRKLEVNTSLGAPDFQVAVPSGFLVCDENNRVYRQP